MVDSQGRGLVTTLKSIARAVRISIAGAGDGSPPQQSNKRVGRRDCAFLRQNRARMTYTFAAV